VTKAGARGPDATLTPLALPYWLRYAGHLLEFGSLDPVVRALALAASAAVVLGLLVLTLPLGHLAAVGALTNLLAIRMPWAVLAAGAILQAAGWWYLLAGAAQAGAALRWPVALAFLAYFGLAVPGNPALGAPLLIGLGYLTYSAVRRPKDRSALAVTGALVALTYLALLLTDAAAVAMTLLNQVMVFYLLFIPVIFYSGFDLGETGLYLTRLALTRLHPRLGAQAAFRLALLVALGKAAILLATWHGTRFGFLTALLVIAVAAALSHLLRPREDEPPELLPFLAALLIVAVLFLPGGLPAVYGWSALLALVAAAALSPWLRRRHALRPALVFLILYGVWNLLNSIAYGPGSPLWDIAQGLPAIGARDMNEAVTLFALGYLAYIRLRGGVTVERALFTVFWMLGLSLALDTWNLFDAMHSLTRGLLSAEAVLLIIGIGHEVLASGGILNRGTRALPRNARVLAYLGYLLLLVGATVLANGTRGPTADLINADDLQAGGLILIGIPLYLQQFLHAFAFGHRPHLIGRGEATGTGEAVSSGLTHGA